MLNAVNSLNPDEDTLEILDTLEVDKNGPKTGNFTIKNIQYTYWLCDCILCQLDFIEPIKQL